MCEPIAPLVLQRRAAALVAAQVNRLLVRSSLEAAHRFNVPTLHMIDVRSRPKLWIGPGTLMLLCRQTGPHGTQRRREERVRAMFPAGWCVQRGTDSSLSPAPVQVVERLRHPLPDQGAHLLGAGLVEKLRHVSRGDGITCQTLFEALESERCQHQQCRNEGRQQP